MSEQIREFQGSGMQVSPVALSCPNGQLYTVRSGDTLFFIARRNNISLQSLLEANPQITDPNTIFPGQVICVPTAGPDVPCPDGQIYRVVQGDTMFQIAQKYGISLETLIRANPQITNPDLILPGQEICIPMTGAVPFVEPAPLPTPIPKPMPFPEQPIAHPMPSVPAPDRPPMPLPCPGMRQPCPPRDISPMYTMPFYIQIPWEECPYRDRKRKKSRCKRRH
jgi:spore coat assembly protein SafA